MNRFQTVMQTLNSRRYRRRYAGGERVASKVGNVADYRGDELTGPRAGDDVGGVTVDYAARYAALTARIAEMYAELGVPYAGTDNDRNGALLSRTARQGVAGASQDDGTEADGGSSPAAAPVRGEEETMRFFYHPDHLGSASYVTDRDGALVQHLEYAPFGEVFLDERGSGEWSSPYLFNAKELDPETGLYYYGARYYDPRLAMWISPDPLGEINPHLSTYHFAINNPINFVDAQGLFSFKIKFGFYLDSGFLGLKAFGVGGSIAPFGGAKQELSIYITFDTDNGDYGFGISHSSSYYDNSYDLNFGTAGVSSSRGSYTILDWNTYEGDSIINDQKFNDYDGHPHFNVKNIKLEPSYKGINLNWDKSIELIMIGVGAEIDSSFKLHEPIKNDMPKLKTHDINSPTSMPTSERKQDL